MTIKDYDPYQETWGNSHPSMRPTTGTNTTTSNPSSMRNQNNTNASSVVVGDSDLPPLSTTSYSTFPPSKMDGLTSSSSPAPVSEQEQPHYSHQHATDIYPHNNSIDENYHALHENHHEDAIDENKSNVQCGNICCILLFLILWFWLLPKDSDDADE